MKVGLIAMSGVRACDAELLRLGLTLPGFVERSRVIASLPSLGLLTLAGIHRHEHTYHYHEVADIRELRDLPDGYDLAAISSFSAQIGEGYALADRYRAAGVPVVMGGLHVTCLPDEALAHADAVVVGEGEAVWPEVLADAAAGQLGGGYRADGRFDLADAPMPAFDLLEVDPYNRLPIHVRPPRAPRQSPTTVHRHPDAFKRRHTVDSPASAAADPFRKSVYENRPSCRLKGNELSQRPDG